MTTDPEIEELLVDWEIARQQGNPVEAEELCRDCPHLLPGLLLKIDELSQTSWLFSEQELLDSDDTSAIDYGSTSDAREFAELTRRSGLVSDDDIAHHLTASVDAKESADARTLASRLVDHKLLTRYQADVLLRGDTDQLILDRYVILDLIGRGGMGVVYKARHRTMDRMVAVKIMPSHSIDAPDKVARFQREVRAIAKLDHPNIVTAYDAHQVDGKHFLVMEYVEGQDLAELVRDSGPIPPEDACSIVTQIASALTVAHEKGIIHRDIKPSNILLTPEGNARLLDLGLAQFQQAAPTDDAIHSGSTELTQVGQPMGTFAYMSPEQAMDAHSATAQSDIYSLGCTLYHLITGHPPFENLNSVQLLVAHRETRPEPLIATHDVPLHVQQCLDRMLAKNPADRFQTTRDLCDFLASPATDLNDPVQVAEFDSVDSPSVTNTDHSTTGAVTPGSLQGVPLPVPAATSAQHRGSGWLRWLVLAIPLVLLSVAGIWWTFFADKATPPIPVNQRDIAKWILNENGVLQIENELGPQELVDVAGVPEGEFEITEVWMPVADRLTSLKPFARLSHLHKLTFVGGQYRFSELADIKSLGSLAFDGDLLSEDEISIVAGIPHLNELEMVNSVLSNDAMEKVCQMDQLVSLSLANSQIPEAALQELGRLPELFYLDVSGVGSVGLPLLEQLAENNQLLEVVLSSTPIEDSHLAVVGQMNSLSTLWLDECNVSDEGVRHLEPLKMLQNLYLENTNITDDAMSSLTSFRSLMTLDIAGSRVTGAGLRDLKKLTGLQDLSLARLDVTDEDLGFLAPLENLIDLNLSNTAITDNGLEKLENSGLITLDLTGCNISEDAIDRFLTSCPECSIIIESSDLLNLLEGEIQQ